MRRLNPAEWIVVLAIAAAFVLGIAQKPGFVS